MVPVFVVHVVWYLGFDHSAHHLPPSFQLPVTVRDSLVLLLSRIAPNSVSTSFLPLESVYPAETVSMKLPLPNACPSVVFVSVGVVDASVCANLLVSVPVDTPPQNSVFWTFS